MTRRKCPDCGSINIRKLGKKNKYEAQCQKCGHCFERGKK